MSKYLNKLTEKFNPDKFTATRVPPAFFYQTPRNGDYFSEIKFMKLDSQVGAALELRKRTAMEFPRQIVGDGKAVNLVKKVLNALTWEHDLEDMLGCLEYGYMPSEIIWRLKDGIWTVAAIEQRDPAKFRFNTENGWEGSVDGAWQPLPSRKFIFTTHKANFEHPYGMSCLLSAYQAWSSKLAASAYMLKLGKKYAVPSLVALTDANNEIELEKISSTLAQLESSSGVALSGVSSVLQLAATGQAEALRAIVEHYNVEISKAITGQSLAMDQGETGSYAQAQVHRSSLEQMAAQDIRALINKVNRTLIRWILELNGIKGSAEITVSVGGQPTLADICSALSAGIPVSKQGIYELTGLPAPKDERDMLVNSPNVSAQSDFSLSDTENGIKNDFLLLSI